MSSVTVQYRVAVTKKDERVHGPDAADVVLTVPLAVATEPGFDATVEYMRGRLKAAGHTGALFEILKSGEATTALADLAGAVE
jgi:hypothetical protein